MKSTSLVRPMRQPRSHCKMHACSLRSMIDRPAPLAQQRLMCGRQFQKGFRIAAGVRMGPLGKPLVGATDFALGKPAAERQSEKLARTLFGRRGLELAR